MKSTKEIATSIIEKSVDRTHTEKEVAVFFDQDAKTFDWEYLTDKRILQMVKICDLPLEIDLSSSQYDDEIEKVGEAIADYQANNESEFSEED